MKTSDNKCEEGKPVPMAKDNDIEKLKKENKRLKKKVKGLEATIKITTQHGDATTEKLEQKVSASEEQYRQALDAMPVPVVIAGLTTNKFFHVNRRACMIFGIPYEEFLQTIPESLYENPEERKTLLSIMEKDGRVNELEVQLKKSNGTLFSASISTEPITFQEESCMLNVIYDLTERKRSEAKILELQEQLDKNEEKYLIFFLAGEEYGIHISKISEILGIMPVTHVPQISDSIKGVINLRGKVIPVVDLRLRLSIEASDYTERTCILVVEAENVRGTETKMFGLIVDSVSEVINIRGKNIEPPPVFGVFTDLSFISGITKAEGDVKILLDISTLLEDIGGDLT